MTDTITAPQSFEAMASLAFVLPESIANGAMLREPDYEITAGTERLLCSLADSPAGTTKFGRLGLSPLMHSITSSEATPDMVASLHELLTNPGTTALRQESTDRLLSDEYDISEAMRIFAPAKKLIEAKAELGLALTTEEENAVVRFGLFSDALSVVEYELQRPFRKTEVADRADFKAAPAPVTPKGAYLERAIEAISDSKYSYPSAAGIDEDGMTAEDVLVQEILELARLQGPKTAASMQEVSRFVTCSESW